jgi:hypothetical protein
MKNVGNILTEIIKQIREEESERFDRSYSVKATITKILLDDTEGKFGIAGIASKDYKCFITNVNGELKFSCDCEDHKHRKKICKHIIRLLTTLHTLALYRVEPNNRTRIEELEDRISLLEQRYYSLLNTIKEFETT